jgi:hypothetical protein
MVGCEKKIIPKYLNDITATCPRLYILIALHKEVTVFYLNMMLQGIKIYTHLGKQKRRLSKRQIPSSRYFLLSKCDDSVAITWTASSKGS